MSNYQDSHLTNKMAILGMSTLVVGIGIMSLKLLNNDYDPIPWMTLVIGVAFGLAITIIVSSRSQKVLDFLANAEEEKRKVAIRTIKNNLKEIKELSDLYFDTINNQGVTTVQKRKALQTFLPKFNTFISICQGTTPTLSDYITTENLQKLETNFTLLNDLFTILEFGTDQQFDANIINLQRYSENAVNFLNEIS